MSHSKDICKPSLKIDLSSVLSLVVLLFGVFQFTIIKFNDFKHVELNQQRLETSMKELNFDVNKQINDLSKDTKDSFKKIDGELSYLNKSVAELNGYLKKK